MTGTYPANEIIVASGYVIFIEGLNEEKTNNTQ